MTAEVENLILEHLRRIRGTVDFIRDDVVDLKVRMASVESQLGHIQVQYAGLNSRMDRFDARLARVEQRLEITNADCGRLTCHDNTFSPFAELPRGLST